MRLLAASHYFAAIEEGASLPDLDERLAKVSREKFRRIDRFIQLAVMGAGECAARHALSPDCALFLASGIGPAGNNVAVQEQLIRDHKLPKPFNFVNTLGSASGYYVAKNLGLSGQSLFVSRRRAAFPAVMMAATADLECGAIKQALVGIVEECVLPLDQHRVRQELPPLTSLAEGVDFFLLDAGEGPGRSLHASRHDELDTALAGIKASWRAGDQLCLGREVDDGSRERLRAALGEPLELGEKAFHDSVDGAVMAIAVEKLTGKGLNYLSGTAEQGWSVLQFGPKSLDRLS